MRTKMDKRQKVFISYSWDSKAHMTWVKRLADTLSAMHEVEVIFDQYDLWAGKDVARFMEEGIEKNDRIILVLTPSYAEKAKSRRGGVGYENLIITGQIYNNAQEDRFIPILRGDPTLSIPPYLRTRLYLDMRDDREFEGRLSDLRRALRRERAGSAIQSTFGEHKIKIPAYASPISWRPDDKGKPDCWEKIQLELEQTIFRYRDYRFESASKDYAYWNDNAYALVNHDLPAWFHLKRVVPLALRVQLYLMGTPFSRTVFHVSCELTPIYAIPMVAGTVYREDLPGGWLLTSLFRKKDPSSSYPSINKDDRHLLMEFALVTRLHSPLRRKRGSINVGVKMKGEGFGTLEQEWCLDSIWREEPRRRLLF
jgi:hypothetical protein